jgi:hypothetical protein
MKFCGKKMFCAKMVTKLPDLTVCIKNIITFCELLRCYYIFRLFWHETNNDWTYWNIKT